MLLLLSASAVLLLVVWRIQRKKCNIPGPWGFPLLGHLPLVNLKAPHLTFTQWLKNYGQLMKVNMGGQELVIVNGYEAIKEMLTKKEFNYRPDFFRINTYRQMGGFGFSEPNKRWKSLRKAAHQGIRSYGPGLERVNRILNHINDTTMNKFAAASLSGEYDPWDIVYSHMLRSITAFTLGEGIKASDELHEVVARLDRLAMVALSPVGPGASLDSAPWLRHFGHPVWKSMQELVECRDKLWDLVRPGLDDSEASSIAYSFLKAKADNPEIDDVQVKCAIGDMMIAGTVTTTISTYCLLQLLCHHPKVQARLQDEIDQVLGASGTASAEDMDDMPYTRATLLEVQRYVTITPLGLPHYAGQEGVIAGQRVRKGTNLLPNIWSLHRDEEFWSEPESFQPERFLTADGELLPADHPNRRRILAFGLGPRLCPGEHFAYNRMFFLITALLKFYKLTIAPSSTLIPYQPTTFGLSLSIEPNRYKLVTSLRQKAVLSSKALYRKPGEA